MHFTYVLKSKIRNWIYVGSTHYEAFFAKEDAIRREDYLKTTKGKSTLRMMLRKSLNIHPDE